MYFIIHCHHTLTLMAWQILLDYCLTGRWVDNFGGLEYWSMLKCEFRQVCIEVYSIDGISVVKSM